MTDVRRVYLRTAAGEWHEAIRDGDGLRTLEADNLDQVEHLEEFDELPPDVEAEHLCRRCFG